jgi:thioredoxin 1
MKNYTILAALFFSISMFSQIEINDNNASSKLLNNNDKLIFVDFYATWCGPCKIMDPIIEELANEYAGDVSFYKLDIDKNSIDDELGITAVPTYFFIKNSATLDVVKGAMSKQKMKDLLDKHLGIKKEENSKFEDEFSKEIVDAYLGIKKEGNSKFEDEFSKEIIDAMWDNYSELNTLAWHAYEYHDDIDSIVMALKLVKRSIELNDNYHNLDTHAALLYKTGSYTDAIRMAKKAIEKAKLTDVDYSTTTKLIENIIKKM